MSSETNPETTVPTPSLIEEVVALVLRLNDEVAALWRQLPHRGLFFGLLAVWVVLFQFLGNSTLGYVNTPSLFGWWVWVQTVNNEESHGWLIPFVVAGLLWWKRAELTAGQQVH